MDGATTNGCTGATVTPVPVAGAGVAARASRVSTGRSRSHRSIGTPVPGSTPHAAETPRARRLAAGPAAPRAGTRRTSRGPRPCSTTGRRSAMPRGRPSRRAWRGRSCDCPSPSCPSTRGSRPRACAASASSAGGGSRSSAAPAGAGLSPSARARAGSSRWGRMTRASGGRARRWRARSAAGHHHQARRRRDVREGGTDRGVGPPGLAAGARAGQPPVGRGLPRGARSALPAALRRRRGADRGWSPSRGAGGE